MELSDLFFAILYGVAFVLLLSFLYTLIRQQTSPSTNVIVVDDTPTYYNDGWWPWTGTYYNYWPYWFPWAGGYGGGYYGGYGRRWGPGRGHWGPGRGHWGGIRDGVRGGGARFGGGGARLGGGGGHGGGHGGR